MSPNSIFICYRRTDAGWAGRLEDELKERFAKNAVFRDPGIAPGVPWRQHIERVLDGCQVMLVMIGPSWTTASGPSGTARLWAEDDVVRDEIERALARPDVTVVPILFDGASMPAVAQLPPGIQKLCERQAAELADRRWDFDIDVLVGLLEDVVGAGRRLVVPGPGRPALAVLAASALAGLLAWPVAGSRVWPLPSHEDPLTIGWVMTTLERVAGVGAHRAILWALIGAATFGAAYLALRRMRSAAPAGLVIGLSTGAFAGAVGALLYVLLKEASRVPDPDLLSEPALNGAGVAVTGFVLAGRFAALDPTADRSTYRAAGMVGGLVAGLLGAIVTEGGSPSLGWAVQSVVLMGTLAALLAAPAVTQSAPAARTAEG